MEICTEILQRNDYRKPCACAFYVNLRGITPYCENTKSPYFMRCPAGTCEKLDKRSRAEFLEQRAREAAAPEQITELFRALGE